MSGVIKGIKDAAAAFELTESQIRKAMAYGLLPNEISAGRHIFRVTDLQALADLSEEEWERAGAEVRTSLAEDDGSFAATVPAWTPRTVGIQAQVLRYLNEHPDVTVYLPEIVAHCGGLTEKQVQNAIGALRHHDRDGAQERLAVVVTGRAWKWAGKESSGQSQGKKLDLLNTLDTGDLILRDANRILIVRIISEVEVAQ